MAGFNAPRAIPVLTSEKLKGYIYHPCFQANSSNEQSCPTIMVKYQSLCKDNYFLEQDFLMTKKKKRNHAMQSTFFVQRFVALRSLVIGAFRLPHCGSQLEDFDPTLCSIAWTALTTVRKPNRYVCMVHTADLCSLTDSLSCRQQEILRPGLIFFLR